MSRKRLKPTQLEIPDDNAAAKWIEAELTGDIGSVTNAVPDRFEAYVRIFHPATNADGISIRWSDVATALGREMHALVQWHALVGSANPDDLADSEWSGGAPERGDLSPEILRPLCALLEQYMSCPEHCFFGLWTGWTSVTFRAYWKNAEVPGGVGPIRSGDDIAGPRFALPPEAGRDYVLLTGPLSAATEIAESDETIGLAPTSPNLIWPADRSWFLASDIDFDSTLVGGSDALVESIVKSSEIEAWRVGPTDSLMADADDRNSTDSL